MVSRTAIVLLGLSLALPAGSALAVDEATEKRLQRLERRVGHITELMLEMQALKRSNSELQGQVEELQHALERLKRKQQELYLDLDERIGQGASSSSVAPSSELEADTTEAPPVASGQAAAPSVPEPENAGLDQQQVRADYEKAYALLQPSKRRYKEAISAFQAFLGKYPPNDYTDNALYWLGESFYVTHDNDQALAAFERLIQEYPSSDKVPGAMLKKAYILDALGKRAEAVQVLNSIVSGYPDAAVANMARARLKHMKKKP